MEEKERVTWKKEERVNNNKIIKGEKYLQKIEKKNREEWRKEEERI